MLTSLAKHNNNVSKVISLQFSNHFLENFVNHPPVSVGLIQNKRQYDQNIQIKKVAKYLPKIGKLHVRFSRIVTNVFI